MGMVPINVSGTGGAGGDAGPSSSDQAIGGFRFGDKVFGGQGVPGWVIGLVVVVVAFLLWPRKRK